MHVASSACIFGVNFGIKRESSLAIEWVWSIRANAGCRPRALEIKDPVDEFRMSKCDPYQEKFLLTERVMCQL